MMPIGDGASVANLQKWRIQEEKKSSSELLCCCASTQLMQFQGFQNHFAILFFLGSNSICSHSKGRFAFLCNEAKNNYVLNSAETKQICNFLAVYFSDLSCYVSVRNAVHALKRYTVWTKLCLAKKEGARYTMKVSYTLQSRVFLVFLKQESSEVYENGMLGAIYASFVYYDLQWIT